MFKIIECVLIKGMYVSALRELKLDQNTTAKQVVEELLNPAGLLPLDLGKHGSSADFRVLPYPSALLERLDARARIDSDDVAYDTVAVAVLGIFLAAVVSLLFAGKMAWGIVGIGVFLMILLVAEILVQRRYKVRAIEAEILRALYGDVDAMAANGMALAVMSQYLKNRPVGFSLGRRLIRLRRRTRTP